MGNAFNFDGFVRSPISALRVSLVTAAYDLYAAFGTRDGGIPRDSQALISNFLRNRLKSDLMRVHQLWCRVTARFNEIGAEPDNRLFGGPPPPEPSLTHTGLDADP